MSWRPAEAYSSGGSPRSTRFEPIQKRIGGGCHLTRDPATLAEDAGLTIEKVDRFVRQGPKILVTVSCGLAVRS